MHSTNGREIVASNVAGGTELAIESELAETVREVIGAAEGPNTRQAYATQAAKFDRWCKRRHTSAFPSSPAVVPAYLIDLATSGADPSKPAKGAKTATVGLALAAISAAHRAAGFVLDAKLAKSARR
jgi:hypothetical protein